MSDTLPHPFCRQIAEGDHDASGHWSRKEMLAGADGFRVDDGRLGEIVEAATRVETELGRHRSIYIHPIADQKIINLAIDRHVIQDDVHDELVAIPRCVAPLGWFLARGPLEAVDLGVVYLRCASRADLVLPYCLNLSAIAKC